jgi:hypothetical protein
VAEPETREQRDRREMREWARRPKGHYSKALRRWIETGTEAAWGELKADWNTPTPLEEWDLRFW